MAALYSDAGARRTRQLLGDLLTALGVLTAVLIGVAVHQAISGLSGPARRFASGAAGLAEELRQAAAQADAAPLIGRELAGRLAGAGRAAANLSSAGTQQVAALDQLATIVGVLSALLPILALLAVWAVPRWRWYRRAAAARRLAATPGGDALLALRALQSAPQRELFAVHPDPAAGWRAADPVVLRALADVELSVLGVRR